MRRIGDFRSDLDRSDLDRSDLDGLDRSDRCSTCSSGVDRSGVVRSWFGSTYPVSVDAMCNKLLSILGIDATAFWIVLGSY